MPYIQVLTSFIVGGLFIGLQTLIAERVSPRFRGLILTIPSTLAMGLLFIGITKSANDLTQAATIIPAAEAGTYIFVTTFTLAIQIISNLKYRLVASLACAFLTWGLSSYFLLKFPPANFTYSVLLYGAPVTIICYHLIRKIKTDENLKVFPLNSKNILTRSILAGLVITISAIFAKIFGNFWGGVFSTFPAVFTSTFIIYYKLQGPNSIAAVSKSLFFPGAIGFMVYAGVMIIITPVFGIWIATLTAYLATFAFFLITTFEKKQKP